MKPLISGALALTFAFASLAAPAFAEQAAPFRSAAPEAFSSQELQQYGLSSDVAERAVALQEQGYQIKVLSTEEAHAYQAGMTDNQWLMLGILAGVIVIAVAVA